MPERTYTGPFRSGDVTLLDRRVPFTRGVPIDVNDEEAAVLDENPDFGGTPAHDDLDGLDKAALREIAEAEQVEVSNRWGADRLRSEIREARLARTAEVDDPADPEEA